MTGTGDGPVLRAGACGSALGAPGGLSCLCGAEIGRIGTSPGCSAGARPIVVGASDGCGSAPGIGCDCGTNCG